MFSSIISTIRGALNKNLLFIFTLILMALAVLLWGQRMGYRGIYPLQNPDLRAFIALVLVTIALVFALFLILRWIWRKIRARGTKTPSEPTEEEIETRKMGAFFADVTKTMRRRWEGRGNPVSKMPWYIVLGAENSGKTALIENSNLRFPIDHEIDAITKRFGKSRSAEFVDWRVSGKEAVLLDIKGENFSAERERNTMQKTLWNAFLSNLSKIRKRRPINGVVIVIDVLEFSQSGFEARENFAERTRQQIVDISEKLGSRLPIYLVFTKMDLISGFNEFHSVIPAEERDKLFGFHFIYRQEGAQDWQSQLDLQVSEYMTDMAEAISTYLGQIRSRADRRLAYAFYRTMYGLREPLISWLGIMFDEDKFSTQPLVRGIYFTSVKQENAPENLFLEVVSHRYALPIPAFATSQLRSKPIFSADLFRGQIFPEADLAGSNRKRRRTAIRRNSFALGFCALLAFGLGFFWFNQYRDNNARADKMVKNIDEFEYAGLGIDPQTPAEYFLPALGLARSAAIQFEGWREKSNFVRAISLDQGARMGPYGDHVYLRALNREYMPALTDMVGDRLRGVCPVGSIDEIHLLLVYRMLGDPDRRQNNVIENYFEENWQESYEGDGRTQDRLNAHIRYALNYSRVPYPVDQSLIQTSLYNLDGVSPSQRVYSAMHARADATLEKEIDLSAVGGANFAYVYETDSKILARSRDGQNVGLSGFQRCPDNYKARVNQPLTVQEFYTRHGFVDYFAANVQKTAALATDNLWAFEENPDAQYSDADIERIQSSVWNIYTGDYVRSWQNAIDDLQIRTIDTLYTAVVVTEALGSVDSPIRRIAEAVSRETIIFEDEDDLDTSEGDVEVAGLQAQSERIAASDIRRSFFDIQELVVPPNEDSPPKIDAVTDASAKLARFLSRIADDPEPSKRALEFAIQRANGTLTQDPFDDLNRVANELPEPFKEQVSYVTNQAWSVILREASYALNERWQQEIYQDYEQYVAGRYPINRRSSSDVPVSDFALFFQPGGKLDQFYREEISPFFDVQSGQPRYIDGQYIEFDQNAVEQLNRAHQVTQSFFDPSGQLNVEFSVTPVSMTRGVLRSVINIEGQTVVYAHGPAQSARVVWPNVVGGTESRVDMSGASRSGGSTTIRATGIWSWLRLIDKGNAKPASRSSVNVGFYSGGEGVTYRFESSSEFNPLVGSPLTNFSLPHDIAAVPKRPQGIEYLGLDIETEG